MDSLGAYSSYASFRDSLSDESKRKLREVNSLVEDLMPPNWDSDGCRPTVYEEMWKSTFAKHISRRPADPNVVVADAVHEFSELVGSSKSVGGSSEIPKRIYQRLLDLEKGVRNNGG